MLLLFVKKNDYVPDGKTGVSGQSYFFKFMEYKHLINLASEFS